MFEQCCHLRKNFDVWTKTTRQNRVLCGYASYKINTWSARERNWRLNDKSAKKTKVGGQRRTDNKQFQCAYNVRMWCESRLLSHEREPFNLMWREWRLAALKVRPKSFYAVNAQNKDHFSFTLGNNARIYLRRFMRWHFARHLFFCASFLVSQRWVLNV